MSGSCVCDQKDGKMGKKNLCDSKQKSIYKRAQGREREEDWRKRRKERAGKSGRESRGEKKGEVVKRRQNERRHTLTSSMQPYATRNGETRRRDAATAAGAENAGKAGNLSTLEGLHGHAPKGVAADLAEGHVIGLAGTALGALLLLLLRVSDGLALRHHHVRRIDNRLVKVAQVQPSPKLGPCPIHAEIVGAFEDFGIHHCPCDRLWSDGLYAFQRKRKRKTMRSAFWSLQLISEGRSRDILGRTLSVMVKAS